ncbi:5-methyltetrahydropteroyltriglutamate--homocysteine S-methyltransferase [Microbacterium stercoris]|uniref:5-methyltetrahydropteroyltriglutamate--homocysteine S-methyltransferase n=1 Tax=Microbacterium stercoris TaxID=2820289 RepID=A0A939QJC4_9MICO|nr:5-methyltetrahydropteroyltriglutamate--homocysteine S-methyltransferase [Microbacterium stercoris]MBO3661900.1 5-methyltetrahydropteroyltriglutamate--homocysteine S-methyltransferase [Microbacterium stercoris]
MTAFPAGTVLGYPRLGPQRELKRALEAHWAGRLDAAGLEDAARALRARTRSHLAALGLSADGSAIPEASSLYDQVLDAIVATGAVPSRFTAPGPDSVLDADGGVSLAGYFTLARGSEAHPALEMTKWFDTNYHYLVPELAPDQAFRADPSRLAAQVAEARAQGFVTRPVLVGPVTLLALAKPAADAPEGFQPLSLLDRLLPVYAELLSALREAGAEWVQLDEPALVSESLDATPAELAAAAAQAYAVLGALEARARLLVTTPYGSPSEAAWAALTAAPVEALAIDLVRGSLPAAAPGLADKTLVAGVVDGRNVWRGDLAAAFDTLEAAASLGAAAVTVGTSTSLQHLPHTVADETALDPRLVSWLAFADERVAQVTTLARGLGEGRAAIAAELDAATAALADRAAADGVRVEAVRARTAALTPADIERLPAHERAVIQQDRLALPILPTTTIGSFPQTAELRIARAQHARGEATTEAYEEVLRLEIARVIGLQEEIGLDVLVHGEPERNDMVQYFAEHLDGFAVTRNGWVQSYGSRATRPSLLWGDVSRPAPITVRWAEFAQSLSEKHVKGMLTGPVTILAWSFVRDDLALGETARQVALALRDEIADLEAAGIAIVQVDEPALRELLPLRADAQEEYLRWSVDAFRLATAGAAPETQIHTHLCYSEFGVVLDAIRGLDADVTSIEAARSRGEVIAELAAAGFDRGIGPGAYDIHSPRVPSTDEVAALLTLAAEQLPLRQVWVNPDCGLKTRAYPETIAALTHLVEATARVRETVTSDALV